MDRGDVAAGGGNYCQRIDTAFAATRQNELGVRARSQDKAGKG